MSPKNLQALVIDPNLKVLADLVRPLTLKGFRVAARTSPEGVLDYVRRSRPQLVLLGRQFWQAGWGPEILAASPGTVVAPVAELPEPDGTPRRAA
jgi:hypothetical protein